jgi:hypothetical protein
MPTSRPGDRRRGSSPDRKLTTACEIIVIGSEEAEERFLQRFV